MDPARSRPRAARTARLAEFVALFVAAPVAVAVALPPDAMFAGLFALTLVGLGLLHSTAGFRWAELTGGWRRIRWDVTAAFTLVTAAVALAVAWATAPAALFEPARSNPALMAAIVLLYPWVSALPQEIVFRPLFFRRYGALLPAGTWPQIAVNAAVFSLAHLMYWSWIVAAMTFCGGLAFAWAYRAAGSFAMAVVLHSIAGWIVFGAGLGVHFYSGYVTRPF